jgi:glycyl-tRNA synthetase alpha chain
MKKDFSHICFSEIINKLNKFWSDFGCALLQPAVTEVGAGTLAPQTLLGCLINKNYNICYVQPSIRPADGRYGENINRLYMHHQYQVILKHDNEKFIDIQNLYLQSLKFIGLDFEKNDVRFIEDNWKNASIGASGLGWEVWLNGTEVTQFTFMQQLAGIHLKILPTEITYGLERLVMCMQGSRSVFDIIYTSDGQKYGDFFKENEKDFSCFALDQCDPLILKRHLQDYICESKRFTILKNFRVAHDFVIKGSHTLNLLDARGEINLNEKTEYLLLLKDLIKEIASKILLAEN